MWASGRWDRWTAGQCYYMFLDVRLHCNELDGLMVTTLMIVYILADAGHTSAFSGLGANPYNLRVMRVARFRSILANRHFD